MRKKLVRSGKKVERICVFFFQAEDGFRVQVRSLGLGIVYRGHQVLNPNQALFDGNGRPPTLFFVENGEANGARRIDVGVEERWHELPSYCNHIGCIEVVVVMYERGN